MRRRKAFFVGMVVVAAGVLLAQLYLPEVEEPPSPEPRPLFRIRLNRLLPDVSPEPASRANVLARLSPSGYQLLVLLQLSGESMGRRGREGAAPSSSENTVSSSSKNAILPDSENALTAGGGERAAIRLVDLSTGRVESLYERAGRQGSELIEDVAWLDEQTLAAVLPGTAGGRMRPALQLATLAIGASPKVVRTFPHDEDRRLRLLDFGLALREQRGEREGASWDASSAEAIDARSGRSLPALTRFIRDSVAGLKAERTALLAAVSADRGTVAVSTEDARSRSSLWLCSPDRTHPLPIQENKKDTYYELAGWLGESPCFTVSRAGGGGPVALLVVDEKTGRAQRMGHPSRGIMHAAGGRYVTRAGDELQVMELY
ncbi:MAG: hypothetical protein C4521_09465 [Actinobacteria bacterium]|nr:MAG: hypothetical protein C4521_09465 [Actinomycetota bacterium]